MSSMIGQSGLRGPTGSNAGRSLRGYDTQQVSNYTPEQMQLFQQMFSHLGPESYLSKLAGGSPESFAEIEAPAFKQFSGLQGNIASRFSGMGSGARRSSGFQNTMNQYASDFAQQLQAQRQGLQQQAIKDLMSMSGDLLQQRPYETFFTPKKRSFLEQLLSGALPLAGAGIGGLFGGPAGASLGGQIGSSAGQAFA